MESIRIDLGSGRQATVRRGGLLSGLTALYYHSPATSGEEMDGEGEAAALKCGIELITIERHTLNHDGQPDTFMDGSFRHRFGLPSVGVGRC